VNPDFYTSSSKPAKPRSAVDGIRKKGGAH